MLDSPAAYLASVGSIALACEEFEPAYTAAAVLVEPVTQAICFLNTKFSTLWPPEPLSA